VLRKIVVGLLILLYSASAIGLPLHFHYCKGVLKHVTLFVKMTCHELELERTAHACCKSHTQCSAGPTMNTCCDDATEWIQDSIPAILARDVEFDLTLLVNAVAPSSAKSLNTVITQEVFGPGPDAGPPPGPPIYLLTCSLIYYG